ncbi:MAG: LptF/LptG family permease [Pseudomonadota bacterium]
MKFWTRFDSYVAASYVKILTLTLVLSVFLFTILDLIGKANRYFTSYDPQMGHLALYYFYQTPFQIIQALPIASLVGAIVTMVGLSRNNETTAVFAAGMSPFRLLRGFVITSSLLSLLAVIANEYVIPKSSYRMHYVKSVLIEKQADDQLAGGVRWKKDGNVFYSYGSFDSKTQTLRQIEALEMDKKEYRISRQWSADSGLFQPSKNDWLLHDIRVVKFTDRALVSEVSRKDFLLFPLPFKPDQLVKDRRDINEFSFTELGDSIDTAKKSGVISSPLEVAFHVKLGYAFSSLMMVFMAIPFSSLSERKTETVKSIMSVFAVAISYWFVLAATRAMANNNIFPPMFGGWTANLFLALAGFRMYRVSKVSN